MSVTVIKRFIVTIGLSLLLVVPAPVLAAVNPDADSAAAAGVQYLANNQASNGSISGFGGESDWSVEAVQASGQSAAAFAHGGASLLDFLKADVPTQTTPATTIERKIIAIAAAGQDITNFGGINYETQLNNYHQGGQIGDATLLNDDIFGIIAIDATQDSQLRPAAQDALNYLLAHQAADGGFSYTTVSCAFCGSDNNDTAAAIIAMDAAEHLGLTASTLAVSKASALNYLLSTQGSDGGFNYDGFSPSDGSSTAWSLMALNMIGNLVATQAAMARDWLLQNQNTDGGFSYGAFGITDSDTYTTAHAVIALRGSTWLLRPIPVAAVTQTPVSAGSGGQQPSLVSSTPATARITTASLRSTFAASESSNGLTPITEAIADTVPQVKGAATTAASSDTPTTPVIVKTKAHTSYAVYAVGLLALVALIWFVLESRKAKGDRVN